MSLLDYFRKVPEMTVEEVHDFVDGRERDALNLVDVRQPVEYDAGHLPGALLIPLKELSDRLAELDPAKPTIVYCASGGRSRAAVAVLQRAQFGEAWSMAGGMKAWQGDVSTVRPEVGMAWFAPAGSLEQTIALAYLLEEGTREYYTRLGRLLPHDATGGLFADLAGAEAEHCDALAGLYREVSGDEEARGFPYAALDQTPGARMVEGGVRLEDAIGWARGKGAWDLLEFAAGMEANAYDIYLHAARSAGHEGAKEVFDLLCRGEKAHLADVSERLARLT